MTEKQLPLPPAPEIAPGAIRGRLPRGALVAGVFLVGALLATTALSFLWTPYDPVLIDDTPRLLPPSGEHFFGTDAFGRDVFSRILHGSRTTLFVGVVAVAVAAGVGVPLGLSAAMSSRRWLDELVMRTSDVLLAFPALLLAIMSTAVFGASTGMAMVAIGIANIPAFARVARAGALAVMASDYVSAARVAGRSSLAVARQHVLPNIASLLIVQVSVSFAMAVLAEAALSYLGLGTPPPTPSWGRMLQESQDFLSTEPLLAFFPGTAIAVAVLGFNLLGDGLRDLLDPRLEGRR
ncbi:peptide/nickel transport system permease protein [Austwickia chelonae]|uniref:Putative ABC transporter permease protein n=1 Tax=Austwickia chelonae NBRC 105200 TaxID=1184607 RepID=K6VPL2_9MICO|nr:ABC transporter permease [Austwickia chelonae]GAB77315.1 putative ABC transporter permease protein [Austwickia chelonae NBRC 105200]SEW07628.1 peptide/nickel transport system permease protein [Austwickia chelonae]